MNRCRFFSFPDFYINRLHQQVNKDFIEHHLNAVDGKPVAGKDVVIAYDGENATLTLIDVLKNKRTPKI